MSRKIDLSQPLSDEDRAYLLSRNKTNILDYADQLAREDAARDAAGVVDEEVTGEIVVEETEIPYGEWKVEELKQECSARNLPVSGTKDELVARLEADDE